MMNGIFALLTSTKGRISRQQWWGGVFALFVTGSIGGIAVMIAVLIVDRTNFTFAAWLFAGLNLLLLWPSYCLGVKRRHDRNASGADVVMFMAGALCLGLLQALGIGVTVSDLSGVEITRPTLWLQIPGFLLSIFGFYIALQLGFLKGTVGSNRYGPDPLNAIN